jgi:hypothetical protein
MTKSTFSPKLLLCTIALLQSLEIFAQPLFTATPFLPHTGDSYTVGRYMHVNEGPTGANQTWDISDSQFLADASYEVVSALDVPCHNDYPEALQAIGVGGGYDMLAVVDNEVLSYGITQTPGMAGFYYSNPQTKMSFPMSYNDTWSDTFNGTDPNGTMRTGNSTATYDGYGTLITPYGTYANVIRLHAHIYTFDITTDAECPADLDYYFWYGADYRYPLAVTWSGTGVCGLTSGSEYLSGIQTSTKELNETSSVSAYPNPFTDQLSISNEKNWSNATIVLLDVCGHEVLRVKNQNGKQFILDTSSLTSGIYVIRILNGEDELWRRNVVRIH